jgi:hypothetical protein
MPLCPPQTPHAALGIREGKQSRAYRHTCLSMKNLFLI